MTQLQHHHEPETKAFNKARDFQDAIIRARKSGCTDPLEVAEAIYDWHMNAARTVQVATLQYAVSRIWGTTEAKMDDDVVVKPSRSVAEAPRASTEVNAKIKAKVRAELGKVRADLDKKWLDAIIPMTGAQVRAAKMLPDDMAKQVGDSQRVGEVFTAAQLSAAKEGARD